MKQVLVFKTTVDTPYDLQVVKPLLNRLLDKNEKWSFDLEDCDRILRVESESVNAGAIIEQLEKAGVACAELE